MGFFEVYGKKNWENRQSSTPFLTSFSSFSLALHGVREEEKCIEEEIKTR